MGQKATTKRRKSIRDQGASVGGKTIEEEVLEHLHGKGRWQGIKETLDY